MSNANGLLILESGLELEGTLFGTPVSEATLRHDRGYGEVVFNTSMTGYQEILTDPSYFGEIICMTSPHIGNTGVNEEDPESARLWCAGFVIQEDCAKPSNWRSSSPLDAYLKKHGIPGISGVDTRALTLHLRSSGVVRGVILPKGERAKAKEYFATLPGFEGRDMIGEVSTREAYEWKTSPGAQVAGYAATKAIPAKYKVVAVDYGLKWNLLRALEAKGCAVEVVPAKSTAAEILARKPDGVFLSNGPGDPAAAPYAAETVRGLLGQVPIFGVCMGHQILGLALGGKTYKLKFGHRGGNQPVMDQTTGKVEISSHNHGYAVDPQSLPPGCEVTHVNLNDKCCEGLAVPKQNAFSVQYHPEAAPGPHDSVLLFDRFVAMIEKAKK